MLVTTRSASAKKVSNGLPCNKKVSTERKISSDRVVKVRISSGLTQELFAERLGVSRNYISMLERGAKEVSEGSSIGLLFQILEAELGHAPAQPIGGGVEFPNANKVSDSIAPYHSGGRKVQVVGWAHAGDAGSYEEIAHDWREVISTDCRDPKAFAVRLEGDSMADRYEEGDILVLQPSYEIYSGCLAVLRFKSDGVIFRRVEVREDRLILVPLNRQYEREEIPKSEILWAYPLFGMYRQVWKR
jgi:SOS-response transcriptional repressor LexA